MMFNKIIDDDIYGVLGNALSTDDVKQVRDLILGDAPENKDSWMFEIVNNPRNSIDVDKFDYL